MMISTCPSVVKMIEFYNPQLLKKLSTTRSGQINHGGAIKTWWAKKENINPENIITVSISPCTSAKYEANNEQLNIDQLKPIDYALTTREFAQLLKKKNINLVDLNSELSENNENQQSKQSSASLVTNISGGMAAAIIQCCIGDSFDNNSMQFNFSNKDQLFSTRKIVVKINDREIKIAVATSPKAIRKIIMELKKNPQAYDLAEFMACPGSCMGGGGQATSGTEQAILQRSQALFDYYQNQKNQSSKISQTAQDFMNHIKEQTPETQTQLICRGFSVKKKYE